MTDDMMMIAGAVLAVVVLAAVFLVLQKRGPPTVFPHAEFRKYALIDKKSLSHDTLKFTLALPDGHVLGLPTGQHLTLRFKDADGKTHQRSYTPVTDNSSIGKVELVIKVYRANVHPKFPDGGKMSQHIDSLKIGDTIDMKGPKGHMEYKSGGQLSVKPLGKPRQERQTKQIIMIAGGTGITPMLQVLNFIFRNPGDASIKVNLLYANQTEDGILVRQELEAIAKEFPDRFSLNYTLDRPPSGWNFFTGFITKEMIEKSCLFNGSVKDTQVLMCGPPPMIKFACTPNLVELGFKDDQFVVF
uniref:FAD-binding FR-type domain-containing protein n=1 Tax=Craspedostauros australis TaxID=1486917 RepID=A0A7R9WYG6_9STRA|eukprot:CAMPEP_0198109878 /NCGR_PEP_ID=MMETSP1442-20131203/1924_1 /TAXON_ID= /ORGANISM="Craspedostauros australis, Strain CCMP3328" /LENGTH=300 /DNA_ID=CAMNT_0043765715 /DNA_START=15 /DNA_END=917 /DNA_ORIENTATION=-